MTKFGNAKWLTTWQGWNDEELTCCDVGSNFSSHLTRSFSFECLRKGKQKYSTNARKACQCVVCFFICLPLNGIDLCCAIYNRATLSHTILFLNRTSPLNWLHTCDTQLNFSRIRISFFHDTLKMRTTLKRDFKWPLRTIPNGIYESFLKQGNALIWMKRVRSFNECSIVVLCSDRVQALHSNGHLIWLKNAYCTWLP